ncbi:MAG: glycyl-radical enzyme activating protein [Saccharofermentanales bacterium]|jgi:pyruvate formate lyase activating enzyme
MVGIITDIQRFCLNDGPGIRTTIFLKGCNMSCAWCHNPETISYNCQIHFYPAKCIGCYNCIKICPVGAQQVVDGEHRIDRALCTGCGMCADICYPGALVLSGKKMTTEQVMQEVLQDKAYYLDSGGGVTLSGGEVLCQKDFALSLVRSCHENNISIGLETNLGLPFETVEPLLREVDLLMIDIKLIDDAQHRKWTGVTNQLVLENITKVSKLGIPIIIRTPLIPGVTDTEENLTRIATFVASIPNVLYYELLNFNPLGEAKYKSLEKENVFEKVRPLSNEKLEKISFMLRNYGIAIKIG